MIKLLRKFVAKFVQASVIALHKDITKVPYAERDNHLSNDILAVGSANRTFLIDLADVLSPSLLDKFFRYAYSIIASINIYIYIYFKCNIEHYLNIYFGIIREFYMAVTQKCCKSSASRIMH